MTRSSARRWRALGALVLLSAHAPAAEDAGEASLQPLVLWDAAARVAAGLGFRDNVLRSGLAPESSAFLSATTDFSLMRLSEGGRYATLVLLFDEQRYLSAPSAEDERFLSGALQAETPAGRNDRLGGELSGLLQHQVIDLSETADAHERLLVDGRAFALRPYWTHALSDAWSLQLDVPLARQLYDGELSGYRSAAAGLRVTRRYGYRSEASVYALGKYLAFDSREERDDAGLALSGAELTYRQVESGAQLKHHFDAQQQWRSTSRLTGLWSSDGSSGYYDYRRMQLSQQLRWRSARWEVKAGVRLSGYTYTGQEVGGETYGRHSALADVRAERRLGRHWLLYVSGEREWSRSNDPVDQYSDWLAGGGVIYEFE